RNAFRRGARHAKHIDSSPGFSCAIAKTFGCVGAEGHPLVHRPRATITRPAAGLSLRAGAYGSEASYSVARADRSATGTANRFSTSGEQFLQHAGGRDSATLRYSRPKK